MSTEGTKPEDNVCPYCDWGTLRDKEGSCKSQMPCTICDCTGTKDEYKEDRFFRHFNRFKVISQGGIVVDPNNFTPRRKYVIEFYENFEGCGSNRPSPKEFQDALKRMHIGRGALDALEAWKKEHPSN